MDLAEHHNGLALLYTRMGRFDRAEEHYRGAIELVADSTDPKLLGDLAAWEYSLGSMLWKIDSVDAAEEMLMHSLAGHQRYRPKETVGIAVIQGRLGEIALASARVSYGEGSRSLITYLCPLADAERTTGDLAASDALLLEAEGLLEPSEGAGTLAEAKVWVGRSRWLIDSGRAKEAVPQLERVLQVYSEAYEPGHSYRKAVESLLAEARSG